MGGEIIPCQKLPYLPQRAVYFYGREFGDGCLFYLERKSQSYQFKLDGKEHTVRLAREGHMLGHTAIGMENTVLALSP